MGADPDVSLRTPAEREAFAAGTYFSAVHDITEPPESAYLSALPGARSTVLRRLVRGLFRGDPDGLESPALVSGASPELPASPAFDRWDGTALVGLVDHPDPPGRFVALPFPESIVVAPVLDVHGYDRLRLGGPVRRVTPSATARVDHPVDLVPPLRAAGAFPDADQAQRIRAELAESAANLALARLAEHVHRDRATAIESTFGSIVDDGSELSLAGADAAATLERIVTEGHPFHPAAKIRRGMSPTAGLSYAPEFTGSIDLRFVAVERDHARRPSTGQRSLTDRLVATFPGLDDAVARSVPSDREPDDYAVIPVHPWQFHRVVPDRYASQIADGVVRPVEGFSHPATPLLNLRTVVPEPTEATAAPPHCKLAIGVQTTNVERTISPQAATNGPRVTDLLRRIVESEGRHRLGILAERAAACYYPPGGPHVEGAVFDDVRHLSGLIRQNPYGHRLVGERHHPVPASSLVATSPASGDPLVLEVIRRYADGTSGVDDATLAFFGDYVEAVVPEQLRLLSVYGVALESHLQNCCVVFSPDGRPEATLVRDLGGIRVHHGRLADRGFTVETYPDSDLDAAGERDLYRKLYYALFQNHLAELVVALVEATGLEEAPFWDLVADRCRAAFADLHADDEVPTSRIDRDEAALFEDPIDHKALTAMRLQGKRHEYETSAVSNPVAAPGSVGVPRGATEPGDRTE